MRRKLDNASGGALFETRVRNRHNALPDQISGKGHAVDDLETRLGDLQARHDQLRAGIEKKLMAWEGKSAREVKAAIKARTEAEAARQTARGSGAGYWRFGSGHLLDRVSAQACTAGSARRQAGDLGCT